MSEMEDAGEVDTQEYKDLQAELEESTKKLRELRESAKEVNEEFGNPINQEQYDGLQREIAETEQKLKDLEKQSAKSSVSLQEIAANGEKLKTAGDKISSAGKKMLPATIAIAGIGAASVKTAAEFEASMSQVQATMGITADSMSEVNGESVNTMDTLSGLAKEMGESTAFSASECAEALNYLALAGYDTQQMCDTLPTVLNLAAAGNLDLAAASDMVTDAMSALGMETSQTDTMVDQMAKTASTTNTSVAQLGEGILTIGATAKSIKGGTAELNTALGILANNGIKGAEGGTHLRNVILALQSPTEEVASKLENLGVSAYDSSGEMRSMNDILGDLNAAMEGMSSAEKDNIISSIFNKTDIAAVNSLLANTGDTWDDLQQSISNSSGAAQQMADTQLDNLEGQITILKSSLESLAISIGDLLIPAIKAIADGIKGFVDWLNGLSDGAKNAIVGIGLLVAAIAPVLIIVGKVIFAVGQIMTVLPALSGAFAAVATAVSKFGAILAANPITIIVAIIAAVIAALVLLYNKCEWFRDAVNNVWSAVKDFFTGVWSNICTFFTETIPNAWNSLVSFFEGIPAWWQGVWSGIVGTFTNIWNAILQNPVVQAVVTTITSTFQSLTEGLSAIWSGIAGVAQGAWELIKNIILGPVLLLIDLITGDFTQLASDAQNIWSNITSAASTIWSGLTSIVSGLVSGLVGVVSSLFSGLAGVISSIWNGMKNTVSNIVSAIKTKAVDTFNNMVTGIKTAVSGIGAAVRNGFNSAISFITSLPGKAIRWGKDFIDGLKDGILSGVSGIVDAVKGVGDKIRSFLHFSRPDEGPLRDYETWMPDMMSGIAKGIYSNIPLVEKAAAAAAKSINYEIMKDTPGKEIDYSMIYRSVRKGASDSNTVLYIGDKEFRRLLEDEGVAFV